MDLSAVGRRNRTAYTLNRTGLTGIGVSRPDVLTNWTGQRADAVADIQIVRFHCSVSECVVSASLALVQRRSRASVAPNIAVITFIVRSIGVGGSGTGLHTDEILQKQPNSRTRQQATGAVSCGDIASMAIGITDQTLIGQVHAVLAIRAGHGAVG